MGDWPADVIERVTTTVESSLEETDTPGATIAMVVDHHSVMSHGIGFGDLERSEIINRDARFYLYSVTKTLLAIATLQLVEAGRLTLDEPIHAILPEFPLERSITVRHLLNHTSGLPDYSTVPEYGRDLRNDPGTPWTDDDFLERTMSQGYLFPVGEGWSYSNVGYMLVRRAIERLTGQRLGEAFDGLLFRLMGLRQTTVATSLNDTAQLTPAYSSQLDEGDVPRDVSRRYHPGWVSHGVVCSTAAETAQILEALRSHRLLQPRSVAAMHEAVAVPASHPQIRRPGYGLGVMIDLDSPYGLVSGHTGGGPGYSTAGYHFPDVGGRRLTVVVLANSDANDPATRIAFAIANELRLATGHE